MPGSVKIPIVQVAVKEVYKAKIIKKTADGKMPLEVALMQQVTEGWLQIILPRPGGRCSRRHQDN
jgi:hypothetical protein